MREFTHDEVVDALRCTDNKDVIIDVAQHLEAHQAVVNELLMRVSLLEGKDAHINVVTTS